MPYYNRDPKRDHNFDNHPCVAGVPGRQILQGFSQVLVSFGVWGFCVLKFWFLGFFGFRGLVCLSFGFPWFHFQG